MKELKAKYQLTVLITTHDMEEANFLCDQLAFLHQGKIAGQGKPAELKASLGPTANLDDVFNHFSGSTLEEGGNYHDIQQTRTDASWHN